MIRFSTALVLFTVLGVLAWTTLTDERIRVATLLVVGLFAVRSWNHKCRRAAQQAREKQEGEQMEQHRHGLVSGLRKSG